MFRVKYIAKKNNIIDAVQKYMGHVAAALKRSHQWCVFLTPQNTKNIQRMTGHCFLRAIRRDLTSYEQLLHYPQKRLLDEEQS